MFYLRERTFAVTVFMKNKVYFQTSLHLKAKCTAIPAHSGKLAERLQNQL